MWKADFPRTNFIPFEPFFMCTLSNLNSECSVKAL